MTTVKATIRNEAGIHCRPSAAIVKMAGPYPGEITVVSESGRCDLKSIMGLLSLGLGPGEKISLKVKGPGEKEFASRLKTLFETHFDFPPRLPGQSTESLLGSLDGQGADKR